MSETIFNSFVNSVYGSGNGVEFFDSYTGGSNDFDIFGGVDPAEIFDLSNDVSVGGTGDITNELSVGGNLNNENNVDGGIIFTEAVGEEEEESEDTDNKGGDLSGGTDHKAVDINITQYNEKKEKKKDLNDVINLFQLTSDNDEEETKPLDHDESVIGYIKIGIHSNPIFEEKTKKKENDKSNDLVSSINIKIAQQKDSKIDPETIGDILKDLDDA